MWLAGAAALVFLVLDHSCAESKTVGELETQASIEKRNAETARSRRKLYDSEQAKIGDLNSEDGVRLRLHRAGVGAAHGAVARAAEPSRERLDPEHLGEARRW